MTTLSWASKAGKLLEFRDLLIKPIQRVCRYPLLLEQLRSPPELASSENSAQQNTFEQALMAIKQVAKDVDDARERQDAIVKNRHILDRFEIHPVRGVSIWYRFTSSLMKYSPSHPTFSEALESANLDAPLMSYITILYTLR
jgi:RhoGEF domain